MSGSNICWLALSGMPAGEMLAGFTIIRFCSHGRRCEAKADWNKFI